MPLNMKISPLVLAALLAFAAMPQAASGQSLNVEFNPDDACADVLKENDAAAAVWALGYFANVTQRPRAISVRMVEGFLADYEAGCTETPTESFVSVLDRLIGKVVPASATSGETSANAAPYQGQAAEVVNAILQPDADLKSVLISLKPTDEDVRAMFPEPMATKLIGLYETTFGKRLSSEDFPPPPYRVNIGFSTTFGLADDPAMLRQISEGFKDVLDKFQQDVPFGRFEIIFSDTGDSMRLDGLMKINGHWVLMLRPYRALY